MWFYTFRKNSFNKKIENNFKNIFNIIESRAIHDFLNSTYSAFVDDKTIKGKSFNIRQETTKNIQKELVKTFAKYEKT